MVSELYKNSKRNSGAVLILVLVEDGLGDKVLYTNGKAETLVLILVLVEDGLGVV